jgi:hypothetical protein
MPGQPVVFAVQDVWGNEVSFYAETWMLHIVGGHPEMGPYQDLIRPCVLDPTAIRESTDSTRALVFENIIQGFPPEDLLRVIVKYTDTSFMRGVATGVVASAFPVDSIAFPNPKVGNIIYTRPSTNKGDEK